MPFAYFNINIYTPRNVFLPMQKTKKAHQLRERVSFSTSNRGSVVVEATLVIPIFLLIFIMLLNLMLLVNEQNKVSNELYDNACKMSKNVWDYNTSGNISISYESLIKDGIVLKSKYKYRIPMWSVNINQVLVFRKWTGESIEKDKESKEGIVYITQSGTVYHTNKKCTYINLSIRRIEYARVDKTQYSGCKLCVFTDVDKESYVYITHSGKRYHLTDECSSLLRLIQEISIENVGDRKLCSRCAK